MATQPKRRPRPLDRHAGALIQALCVGRGWNAADLAFACGDVAKERSDPRFAVSRRTIERVMYGGKVPNARVQCGIALALAVAPWDLWGEGALPLPGQHRATDEADRRAGDRRRASWAVAA